MAEVVFTVNDIHCGNCARNIRRGLFKLPGVEAVTVDETAKRVMVDFDARQISPASLHAQLDKIGFPSSGDALPQPLQAELPTALWRRYRLSLIASGLVIFVFIGFLAFPRYSWKIPADASLWLVALTAGVASFFAPCSFPLLATFLTHESGTTDRSLERGLRFALPLALGMSAFLLLAGVILAIGGAALFSNVTFSSFAGRLLRGLSGVLLLVLGLSQLGRLALSFNGLENLATPLLELQTRQRDTHPIFGFAVLGFAYPLAGFG